MEAKLLLNRLKIDVDNIEQIGNLQRVNVVSGKNIGYAYTEKIDWRHKNWAINYFRLIGKSHES